MFFGYEELDRKIATEVTFLIVVLIVITVLTSSSASSSSSSKHNHANVLTLLLVTAGSCSHKSSVLLAFQHSVWCRVGLAIRCCESSKGRLKV